MIRKILIPIGLFIFGAFFFFLETLLISFLTQDMEFNTYSINFFNKIFFITLAILLFVIEVIPTFKKIDGVFNKIIYTIPTLISISLITYYWIITVEWK